MAFNTARLGGGINSWANPGNMVTLHSVTLARNTATDRGIGGIALDPGTGFARATLIADNTGNGSPSNCSQALTSNGWNVETGTNCGFTQEVDQNGVDEPRSRLPTPEPRRPDRRAASSSSAAPPST